MFRFWPPSSFSRGLAVSAQQIRQFRYTVHQPNKNNYLIRNITFVGVGSLSAFLAFSAISTHRQLDRFQQYTYSSRGTRIIPSWEDLKQQWHLLQNGSVTRQMIEQRRKCRALCEKYLALAPPFIRDQVERLCNGWHGMSDNQRVTWLIIGLNAVVFGAWRIPSLQRQMNIWFVDHALTRHSVTMLTACFSHQSTLHFAANMYAFHSFAPTLMDKMGGGPEHFLAFYLSAGMFSSLFSRLMRPWLMSGGGMMQGSLGASGALFAMLGVLAWQSPNDRLQLIFLPAVTFTAMQGLAGLMVVDAVGLAMRSTVFDHCAHLGGALVGLAYARFCMDSANNNFIFNNNYNNNMGNQSASVPVWPGCQRFTYNWWGAVYGNRSNKN